MVLVSAFNQIQKTTMKLEFPLDTKIAQLRL